MPNEFKPGKYSVEAAGHNDKLPMDVTLSENRIEKIEIDTSGETEGIATTVFERIPAQIIENQTLNVDTVSGATVTSHGILDGVANAIELAGGNPRHFKEGKKVAPSTPAEDRQFETDVLIIGGGGAGLSAAASAIQEGKKVILVEKFPMIGGNTARTGGPMNAAHPEWQNTFEALPGENHTLEDVLKIDEEEIHKEYRSDFNRLKREIKDYLEQYDEGHTYLFDSILWHRFQTYVGGKRTDLEGKEVYGDYELVKALTDNVLDSVKWLEDIGVAFDKENIQMPVGANWRRGHKPLENEGYAYIDALSRYVESNDGKIITDVQIKELLTKDGKVVGAVGEEANGATYTFYSKAVVLTSGGFGANTEMLQEHNTYWTEIDDDIKTSNSPAITGDGIKLGQTVGADLVDMGMIQMLPTCDPETGALFTGLQVPPANFVMVDQTGNRFVNEYGSRDEISQAAIAHGTLFYLIADDRIKETAMNTSQEAIDKQVEEGTLFRADTLEELAEQINVDKENFVETIEKYNSYVDAGEDPEFGKNAFDLKILEAPFYATPRKPAVHHTMGGLKINANAEVIDTNGKIIPGFYAAGEVTGGIHAGNRLGGNALADIFTFGRIAGRNASRER